MFYFAVLTHNRSFNKSKREEPHEVATVNGCAAFARIGRCADSADRLGSDVGYDKIPCCMRDDLLAVWFDKEQEHS